MAIALRAIQRLIEVDGSEIDRDIDAQLERVVVVDRLAMPDTFVLTFRDPDRDVLERGHLKIGTKVAISTTSPMDDAQELLISGEVTSIEAEYDRDGTRAVIRGYDLSHRLIAGRKTATFQNVKLSDIAAQIARSAGLEPDVDDSGATVEHVIQANLCDLDFLYTLAGRIGFDCRVDGQTLRFKRPTPSSDAPAEGDFESTKPTQLVWAHNLLEFRARMSAVAQVSEVRVRGWDVEAKQAVIGQAGVSATTATVSTAPSDLANLVGGRTLVLVDRPVDAQEAADEVARATAEKVGSAAFEATAVAIGSPTLKAGVAVNVSNIEPALAGTWVISSSRHEFGADAYRTVLEFSGRRDRSLRGVIAGGMAPAGAGPTVISGVVTAIVTNNEDPAAQGRVKVHYPWLSDNAESSWARLAMPGAGNSSGMVWVPQVGDEVLVTFVQGDISHPIVIGGLWNGKDVAPLGEDLLDAGTVKRSGFVSRKGHRFVFFDADDDTGLALLSAKNKFRVSLNETKSQLHVYFDGKLLIDGTGDVEIKTKGSLRMEAGGAMTLKASGVATIKGSKVALNPPGA